MLEGILSLLLTINMNLATVDRPAVDVNLVADKDAAVPGQNLRVGVWLKIPDGWHIYWKNSGESGLPTRINLHFPDGITPDSWKWPYPSLFQDPGGSTTFGYSGEVVIQTQLKVPQNYRESVFKVEGDVRWLICREVCIPGRKKVELRLPVKPKAEPMHRDLLDLALMRVPVCPSGDVSLMTSWGPSQKILNIGLKAPAEMMIKRIIFFPESREPVEPDYRSLAGSGNSLHVRFPEPLPSSSMLRGVLVVETLKGTYAYKLPCG